MEEEISTFLAPKKEEIFNSFKLPAVQRIAVAGVHQILVQKDEGSNQINSRVVSFVRCQELFSPHRP